MNGAQVQGKVLSNDPAAKTLTLEFSLGGSIVKRTVPHSTVHAITVDGVQTILTPKAGTPVTAAGSALPVRSPAEIEALIQETGSTSPDWLANTRLNYPKTLDLSWPEKPPQPWNHDKNMGQFIWDIVNPNSNRWRDGIKLMYHLMDLHKADAATHQRVMSSLASMFFRFFQDYSRAAYWWQKAGLGPDDNEGAALAECYWRLGSKQMALDFIAQSEFLQLSAIKLLGDMLETDKAVAMAADYVRAGGSEHEAYLLAGDALRIAGRFNDAAGYYTKAATLPVTGQSAARLKKLQARAQANLEALRLFELADLQRVRDGTYHDSSLGYEGQIQVSVSVRKQRIESVKITQHKEKQYYSALTDVPAQIISKQGVKGVDATSRATITAEAIINATAKALAKGVK